MKIFQDYPDKILSIMRSNVAGGFLRPNGITLTCHKPPPRIEKAVLHQSFSAIGTCQYPDFKSRVLNHCNPFKASKVSSILGNA